MTSTEQSSKVGALVQLIANSIGKDPHELYGYKWCKMSHRSRAAALGMSERTLRRMVGSPPGKAPFVSTCRVIGGVRTVLLRVGEPGPPTPEDEARKMVSVWRSWLNKHIPQQRKALQAQRKALKVQLQQCSPKEAEAIGEQLASIDMRLARLREKETPNEYGCMVGLAKEWPDGLQVELFKVVVNDWIEFMAGVKVVQAGEASLGTAQPMYFKFPHIKTIRRYHKVAVEMMTMSYQKSGKQPPKALIAVQPNLWKHLKTK